MNLKSVHLRCAKIASQSRLRPYVCPLAVFAISRLMKTSIVDHQLKIAGGSVLQLSSAFQHARDHDVARRPFRERTFFGRAHDICIPNSKTKNCIFDNLSLLHDGTKTT